MGGDSAGRRCYTDDTGTIQNRVGPKPASGQKGRKNMDSVLKAKRVSYGLVELVDSGNSWARYSIRVNGSIKEVSDDLNFLVNTFDSKYY